MNSIEKWINSFLRNYNDPDGIKKGKKGYIYNDKNFYDTYANCLKGRSNKFDVKIEGDKPGLVISSRKTRETYCLKSDQLGFSAPSIYLKHPYDVYLLMFNDDKLQRAIENVENWINNSRVIGGSFFWPMEFKDGEYILNPEYNKKRGGTKFKKQGSYIEDRVDLTLFEIKEIFDSGVLNDKNRKVSSENILYNECFSVEMKKWLSEFDSFNEYVEFFAFNPFVDPDTYIPYDILEKPKTKLIVEEKGKRVLYDRKDPYEYELMFNNIIGMIKERKEILEQKK